MRELEIAAKGEHYHRREKIRKKLLIVISLAIIGILVFTILTKNIFFLFIFLTLLSTVINYQTNLMTIRLSTAPEVFSSLLITRVIGLNAAIIMLFIPTLFVEIYTGRLDKDTLIFLVLTGVINIIMSFVPGVGFVVMGMLLITLRFVSGLLINMALGISPQEILFEHILGYVSNVIMFLAFGSFLIGVFS
ncbi:MAG: hypothetical protein ABIJ34_09665 [archaeon]